MKLSFLAPREKKFNKNLKPCLGQWFKREENLDGVLADDSARSSRGDLCG